MLPWGPQTSKIGPEFVRQNKKDRVFGYFRGSLCVGYVPNTYPKYFSRIR